VKMYSKVTKGAHDQFETKYNFYFKTLFF